jgi:hypothetical protein
MKRVVTLLLFFSLGVATSSDEDILQHTGAAYHPKTLFRTITEDILRHSLGLGEYSSPDLAAFEHEATLRTELNHAVLQSANDILAQAPKKLNNAFALCASVYTSPAVS